MKKTWAVFAVATGLAWSAQAAELDGLAKNLARGADVLKNKRIAVLAFPYHDGRMSSGSSVISERLTTGLVGKKKIRVIERRLIQQLLAEKKLNETGAIDNESLKTIGSVLDADAIVTGTLIDLDDGRTEINARMIQSDSGEVLAAGREMIRRTWEDAPVSVRPEPAEAPAQDEAILTPEELEELNAIERQNRDMRPDPSARKKNAMKLSNESFPPGRRLYHSNQPAKPSKLKVPGRYESQERYDSGYDSGYQEGYFDAARDNINKPAASSGYPSRPAEPDFQEPTLQHPTRMGTVQEEYRPNSYPTYNYPPSGGSKTRRR